MFLCPPSGSIIGGDNMSLEQLAEQLASELHESWRAPRKLEEGVYEPRWKTTSDEAWISEHETDQVDIANTQYASLPANWQQENRESAHSAMETVHGLMLRRSWLNEQYMEHASTKVHDAWIQRHKDESWAEEAGLLKPYAELPEEEKKKDRDIVIRATDIYRANWRSLNK